MLYTAVLILLVLEYLRPQEFVGIVYAERLVLYTMLAILPFWLFTLLGKKIVRTAEDLFMFLLGVMAIVSYLKLAVKQSPLALMTPFETFGKLLLIYLLVAHVTSTPRRLAGAVSMLLLMFLVLAFLAGPITEGPEAGTYASVGNFGARNEFCDAMAMVIPMNLALILLGRPLLKIAGAFMLIIEVPELVLGGGRGALIAALAGAVSVLFMRVRTTRARFAVVLVGLVVFGAVWALSPRLQTMATYRTDESAMGRVRTWESALQLFRAAPILGHGFRRFEFISWTGFSAHSSYLQVLAELGAFGLFLYVGLFYFAIRHAYAAFRESRNPTTRMLGLCTASMLVAHSVSALTATYSYHSYVLVQFAVASALRVVLQNERAEEGALPVPVWEGGVMPGQALLGQGGPSLMGRELFTRRDLMIVGALTFGCWLAYQAFVLLA